MTMMCICVEHHYCSENCNDILVIAMEKCPQKLYFATPEPQHLFPGKQSSAFIIFCNTMKFQRLYKFEITLKIKFS
jgi:hypothetical protein